MPTPRRTIAYAHRPDNPLGTVIAAAEDHADDATLGAVATQAHIDYVDHARAAMLDALRMLTNTAGLTATEMVLDEIIAVTLATHPALFVAPCLRAPSAPPV